MKKFLSLVLALVMTMSLVTVSAGAKDFTDSSKINYKEAVDVMSAAKVIDGYAEGDFRPTNTLTRGAAAKIICNLILGPTTASALVADAAPYKDVPTTNTFAGYIAYCAKEKIISGYADGTFRPANSLTGYAFMKMLLGALGYDSAIEGYTGANWSIAVAKQAINAGLNNSLKGSFNGVKAVTREEACLYAFNTLKATMVEYDNRIVVGEGSSAVAISGVRKDLTWNKGTLNDGKIKKDGYVQFGEQYFEKLVRTDDTDDFGRPSNKWTYDKKDIGTYVNTDLLAASYTAKVKGGDVYTDIGSNACDFALTYWVDGVKLDKKDLSAEADKLVKKNDDTMNSTGNGVLTEIYVDTDAEETTVVVINTYLAEVSADYNTKTEDVRLDVYTGVKKAAAADKTPTTISAPYTVESEDVDGLEKLKEDDMVLVTIAKGDVMTVTPVETVKDVAITSYSTGYVDADKKDEYKLTKLTAGGNKYETAKKAFEDAEVLYDYNVEQLDDATFDLYLDPYGYVIGARQVDGDDNFMFVVGYDRSSTVLAKAVDKALAIFTDGTMETIDVKSGDLEGGRLAESATTNTWFKYTVKNGVYNLEEVADEQIKDSTTTKLDKQNNTVEQVVGGKKTIAYGNNDTILIAVKADDDVIDEGSIVKVEGVTTGIKHSSVEVKYDSKLSNFDGVANKKNGKNSPETEDDMIFALYNKNGYITYAVVVGKTAGSSESMVYLTSGIKSKSLENGDYIYTYEAITKDGAVTVNSFESKDNSTPKRNNLVLGNLYEGTFDKNNVITEMEAQAYTAANKWSTKQYKDDGYAFLNVANVSELTAKGATLWIDDAASNDKYILLDEDCKIFVRASDDDEDDYTEYSNIKSALSALGEDSNFTGTIAAFVDDAGIATTLILNDTYKANDKPNTNPSKPTSTDVDSVKLTIKGSKGLIELFNKKGDALTDTTVKHSFELYQYVAGQNNYVKVDEGDYFYNVTPAFSVADGNSYYVVIDGVQSNIARA